MSGNPNTTTTNTAKTANTANTDDSRFFTGERGEFGMYVFSDPSVQATYDFYEDGYRKKIATKEAFDKQELLRKMRTDFKREYLTRKKQVARLQKYAAVEFRNAEMSLQEHYASVQARQHEYRQRAIDITAPLESRITLSSGEVVDLKTFDHFVEFERIVGVHASLLQEQKDDEDNEDSDEWFDEPQRQCCAAGDWDAMMEQRLQNTATHGFGWVSCESPRTAIPTTTTTTTTTTTRSAFGGCYDYTEEELEQQRRDQEETQTRELGQYFVNKWAQLGLRRQLTDEEIAILVAGTLAEHAMNDPEYDPTCDYTSNVPTFHQAMHLEELLQQEQIRDVESFAQVLEDCTDEALRCDIEQRALELPDEPASEGNSAIPLPLVKAKKPRTATSSATKARIAKQQRKNQGQQQKRKFVPITITINDNHATHKQSEALLEMISSSKVEINLPKKSLQNMSRDAKKAHNKKWNCINAQAKQSAARGTRIADIPRKWDCNSYSDEE
jgi:hypothetical protein